MTVDMAKIYMHEFEKPTLIEVVVKGAMETASAWDGLAQKEERPRRMLQLKVKSILMKLSQTRACSCHEI